ncbi:YciI family protein [Dyadobacter sp. 676]|uniref:YciI family protein n=1 Tax=Dyadobacter sp. 676 TaxID=3088362 RepID=A0AAU8FF72_9BACT
MKALYITLLTLASVFAPYSGRAQSNIAYDSTLAKKLNADEYGMKKYVMVFLKTGSAANVPKSRSDSAFAGHMQNINRLAASGKLVVAGPFFKNDKYRGIFILNADTIEEGRKLVETDPAVQAGLLDMELLMWYGSAALAEIPEIHKKIEKKSH